MSRGILDTSVLIASTAPTLPAEAAISSASLAELHFGVLIAKTDDERALRLRRLTEIESRFSPLPVDAPVARSYGVLAARTVSAGRQPRARVMDLLIAATAHAHGVPLYTHNPRDFAPLSELVDVRDAGVPASTTEGS